MARAAAAARVAAPARSTPTHRPMPARRPAPARRRPAHETATHKTREFARARGAAALDALLHGPALIGLVFMLLVGVVFSNVALLQKNREIARDAERATALKRENAGLRRDVAELGSSERIQQVAAERGLVLPAPGEVQYLRSNPRADARNAAKNLDESSALAGTTYVPPVDPYVESTTPPADTTAYDPAATTTDPTAIAGTPDAVTGTTVGVP
jgi:cell division protein FtsL